MGKKKNCITCVKSKDLSQFYLSYSSNHGDKRTPICKLCVRNDVDFTDLKNVRDRLLSIDKPFLIDRWNIAIEEHRKTNKHPIGCYVKNIILSDATKYLTYKDSVFESSHMETIEISTSIEDNEILEIKKLNYDLKQLKSKYGYGYPDDEYYLFEDKYQQLKTSFQLLTTMHEEYFREFCVNKVKETLAKAKGLFKEAKEWAAMVKDVAEAGKLKPSQMSKADLSGGLDTFGQLARMVEENHEIMQLLPRFTEQPKDKVDVTLWCYINYVRDLKGLPECEYKEIYAFYDMKKQDYESQMSDARYGDEEDDVGD
ncbi:hypothetical protein BC351_10505 [Paenibacillus ferrarius]|uniref:Uncharacterized protein n=1 Tax=Paenibacillus ferrarius TaxID=1469647 RepID=A0A1V4HA22_9BACL|nr:hypothetical protein BC351_10505 [Paenibacillus ferrarius]